MTVARAAAARLEPFAHVTCRDFLPPTLLEATLAWLEAGAPWRLRVASFYEQWEFHLSPEILPDAVGGLLSPDVLLDIRNRLVSPMGARNPKLVEVTAHKLVAGQTIRIHNDFIGNGGETHRVLVQLNRGWRDEQGGLLMLFGSSSPEDVRRVVRPIHGSAFSFAISPASFHAVTRITEGERFTLVYSFEPGSEVA